MVRGRVGQCGAEAPAPRGSRRALGVEPVCYLHDLDELQEQPLPVLGLLLQHDDGPHPAGKGRQAAAERPRSTGSVALVDETRVTPVPVSRVLTHQGPTAQARAWSLISGSGTGFLLQRT